MNIQIELPACKSIVIRELIIHFISTGEILPVEKEACSDINVTARALESIRNGMTTQDETIVDVQDCGAAYRFLLPVLAGTPGSWILTGTSRLLQRPIEELVTVLQQAGAQITQKEDGLHILGKSLHLEEATIDCSRTSQYASALLMAAPLIGLKTLHITPDNVRSSGYIDMTRHVIERCAETHHNASLREGDWDAALFWYAYALLNDKTVVLENLTLDSIQSDKVIATWFDALGVESESDEEKVILTPTPLASKPKMTLDVADHPDTVPVMAVLAALLPADIRFRHTRNLQYKESNRIQHLAEQLRDFADIEVGEDELLVTGRPDSRERMAGCCFRTWHDHRLAMAFLLAVGPENLDDTDCLKKSYPNLLELIVDN